MARFFEILFLLFIAVFLRPIIWLSKKFGGSGAGAAWGSFFISAIAILCGIVCLGVVLIAGGSYFLIK